MEWEMLEHVACGSEHLKAASSLLPDSQVRTIAPVAMRNCPIFHARNFFCALPMRRMCSGTNQAGRADGHRRSLEVLN